MEAMQLRYYLKLWRLNFDWKSVSDDTCRRSVGKLQNCSTTELLCTKSFS